MVRSLRELFVDDLDLLLEHLAGVHTVVARVSRASLQADTAASTDLLDRFFQLRAEHVPQLTDYQPSTLRNYSVTSSSCVPSTSTWHPV